MSRYQYPKEAIVFEVVSDTRRKPSVDKGAHVEGFPYEGGRCIVCVDPYPTRFDSIQWMWFFTASELKPLTPAAEEEIFAMTEARVCRGVSR